MKYIYKTEIKTLDKDFNPIHTSRKYYSSYIKAKNAVIDELYYCHEVNPDKILFEKITKRTVWVEHPTVEHVITFKDGSIGQFKMASKIEKITVQ